MYLLNERLRYFFTPLIIATLMLGVFYFFSWNKDWYSYMPYYTAFRLAFYLSIILFLIYVVYPFIKILYKNYGTIFQRIIIILLLISSTFALYFTSTAIIYTLIWIIYLAIFLNFSSNIEKKNMQHYILSYPNLKNSTDFSRIINTSSFNVLMTVVLLTITVADSLTYSDWYRLLTTLLAIVLVISSIIYGKTDKSIDY